MKYKNMVHFLLAGHACGCGEAGFLALLWEISIAAGGFLCHERNSYLVGKTVRGISRFSTRERGNRFPGTAR